MTLIERSRAFATDVTELDRLQKTADLVSAVGSRAEQLEFSLAKLRLAVGQLRMLRERGVAVTVDLSPSAGFAHHLANLADAAAADPAAVTAPEVKTRTLNPLGTFTKTITDSCKEAWGAHVKARLPRVGTDLIPVLARVPALRAKVERFRTLQASAQDFAETLPTGAGDVEAFHRTAADCQAAWDALDAEAIPPRVMQFLRAATSEAGAGLDSLDQEVTDWLEVQDLCRSFVVRTR